MPTWQILKNGLRERGHRTGIAQGKDTALLTSILRCDVCSGAMYRIINQRGQYYYCRARKGWQSSSASPWPTRQPRNGC